MNIHAIETWPPGSLMAFRSSVHQGVGIVIHNDGEGRISVVWGANCRDLFCTYSVKSLNVSVISRVE